ncbi:MAG TPA: hypothetical protein VF178_00365 [Gemmatimonadaceae bacterium]
MIQRFFRAELDRPSGEVARRHLHEERALPAWAVDEEAFGYVPEGRTRVVDAAVAAGVPLEVCAEAGLVKRSDAALRRAFRRTERREPTDGDDLVRFWRSHCEGRAEFYYDYPVLVTSAGEYRWGDWLTIPIHVRDDEGRRRIGGFQYRSMRPLSEIGKEGRYRSPRPSAAISWPQTLIGLAGEDEQIARSGWAVICEGKFDQTALKVAVRDLPAEMRPGVIALGGVSTRGHAASDDPIARAGVLGQIGAGFVTFCTDGDVSGLDAVLRLGPLLVALGTKVSAARIQDVWDRMPAGMVQPKDPGEVLARLGAQALREMLAQGRTRDLGRFASELLEDRLAALTRSGQLWRRLIALDHVLPALRAVPGASRGDAIRRTALAAGLPLAVVECAVDESAIRSRETALVGPHVAGRDVGGVSPLKRPMS